MEQVKRRFAVACLERWTNGEKKSKSGKSCLGKYTYVLVEDLGLVLCCDKRHGE
jgi:hypothetical protein